MAANRDSENRRLYSSALKRAASLTRSKNSHNVIVVPNTDENKNFSIQARSTARHKRGMIVRNRRVGTYYGTQAARLRHSTRRSKSSGGGRGKPDFKD